MRVAPQRAGLRFAGLLMTALNQMPRRNSCSTVDHVANRLVA
jgi:hypothetical protein|tara:strand:+ start:455 stop:580 length:126 start_codon:yes stop_codon:yes gene_type:complete